MLSIVLPTFNEARSGCLPDILTSLSAILDAEIIIVDGGSTDATLDLLQQTSFRILNLPGSTRAARLRLGIAEASGDIIFLHHPRSLVGLSAFEAVKKTGVSPQPSWGGLTHQFDFEHPLLRFTSWYSNKIRFDRRGIVYLDHCIFFQRSLRDQSLQLVDIPIFEDTELSLLLRKVSNPVRLDEIAKTSSIRFQQNGIFKQAMLNQLLKIAYFLGMPRRKMNNLYEKGLDLNN